ncbi:uncharacterized protein si:ch211-153b23.3 [Callorhinchus milii]|uniref:Threonylcarbamoyl-AMP synthase n=1 Tax=Callorhinchus milii TaxID=7868 RepID=A0A4W3GYJ2_CALMI|nr:uncharacterized protein si:ch211-153b23.3 [Callorhinchus milii]XP_042196819.1 uncharacterized protein si:ch211-153b23.3 [Callorhinchus milii]|eukprot:gi/632935359/ref/XP_007889755.1/ PREDICTED: uncharacterized protein LOC103177421 [Callorhinchus milii]
MSSSEGFAAIFYSEPGVLGLLANVISAFLVALQNFTLVNTNIVANGIENILAGVHLILIGGVMQLVAGLLTFRKYDHLGGTAFVAFSALWSSFGATRIIQGANLALYNTTSLPPSLQNNSSAVNYSISVAVPPVTESAVAGLVAYISVAFILTFCSATANYIMPFVFGAITITLVFEAVGLFGQWAFIVSGIFELIIVLFGLYGAAALLLKGITQRYVLPGFGNSLFNVLLLGAANKSSAKSIGEEKKKNTKYAEPMALGVLCDVISPFIFAFYCFGYLNSFYVGAVWISINSLSQLLASYYAYLRGDVFFTTKFGVHATFWLVKSWEEFILSVLINVSNVDNSRVRMAGDWFFLVTALILCLMSLNKDILEIIHNSVFILLTISTIPQINSTQYYNFFGAMCAVYVALSLYATFASLINSIAEKALIPIGTQVLSSATFQNVLFALKRCLTRAEELPSSTSAYLPDALFYICNGLAALSAIQSTTGDQTYAHLTIPWVLIPGTLIQLYVSRIQVQGGKRFGSVLPFSYAIVWATWTWLRFAGQLLAIGPTSDDAFTAGAIAFLIVNMFLIFLATYVNIVLLVLTVIMEVVIICFLLFTVERLPLPLEGVMLGLFSLVCVYGAFAAFANSTFGKQLIPLGSPLFKPRKRENDEQILATCTTVSSQKTSGLRTIANIVDSGKVCGIPTDTVYALAVSCKHPAAIEKIYNIKDRPAEKPICICISNLEQLIAVHPPFSPLLWELMRNVYPGGISCIVKKGDWLRKLGIGAAYDRVGTKDSIMIRVPDHTVTAHLVAMTGPLAITSANPSGEPDSTHHDMVISRLGHKIDGVLCDGFSNELVASTVINCTKIDEDGITILREGCVPAAKVLQIFERVKNKLD